MGFNAFMIPTIDTNTAFTQSQSVFFWETNQSTNQISPSRSHPEAEGGGNAPISRMPAGAVTHEEEGEGEDYFVAPIASGEYCRLWFLCSFSSQFVMSLSWFYILRLQTQLRTVSIVERGFIWLSHMRQNG